jgi:hypothetical protein
MQIFAIKLTNRGNNNNQIMAVVVPTVCFGTIVFSAAYPVCQVGCAGVFIACYSAAGFVLGETAGAMVPATNIACNASFGKCQGACVLVLL